MGTDWISTKYPGVRYREHESRKFKGKPDRYYTIRYTVSKNNRPEERIGWRSEGVTPEKAASIRGELLEAIRTGKGPRTLKEMRQMSADENAKLLLQKMTFGEIWNRYLEWAKANKTHWSNDEYRYRLHIKPTFNDKMASSVTPYALETLKQQLIQHQAPATTKHCLVIVRQIINKALNGTLGDEQFRLLWPEGNPVNKIKLPSSKNEKQRVLESEEEDALLKKLLEKSWITYCFAMTSLYTGLRFCEVANLKWYHIDRTSWSINLTKGKGALERKILIPVHAKLKSVLREQWEKQNSPPRGHLVFPNRNGQVSKKLSRTYARTVKELGLNNEQLAKYPDPEKMTKDDWEEVRPWLLDFQTLRHTFATRLGEHAPLPFLRDILGHRSLQMTTRYAKSKAKDAAGLINQV